MHGIAKLSQASNAALKHVDIMKAWPLCLAARLTAAAAGSGSPFRLLASPGGGHHRGWESRRLSLSDLLSVEHAG